MQNDSSSLNILNTKTSTPLKEDAFLMDDEMKISLISERFGEILEILGLDLSNDSLKGTPDRIAKMYVKEIFSGLNPANRPEPTLFDNSFSYGEMLVEKNISVFSNCEHHFVPITGKAHVAYVSSGKVIGLSKLNRIVQYYAQRPQIQERLTIQIAEEIAQVLATDDVAVMIDANHHCVSARGIRDISSSTITTYFGGQFKDKDKKNEFLTYISK
ncbi:GTP cyclohydrolase I FolE [Pedobacter sp. Leaf194]|uniref:GTP cyclohydrolase I FolE n=1 Tax=Pedobacter sp. Leaf194 TaxID=1736297 RepID=UPI00070317F6|nr:GTP cyclohydrolase I FolE [Pedobacter sp. Leaf194]KQS36301.1 GTP cyclohydrolase [Pedobacter sp. Leaf194]RZJ75376.1 MAG: GTP cyclohydrolase I FolE [Flavobacterium sp.]